VNITTKITINPTMHIRHGWSHLTQCTFLEIIRTSRCLCVW